MNEKEFRNMVMPLQRMMYALAQKLGLPPDDAADAVQEAQLRLWRGRDSIPLHPLQLRSYCLTALRNEAVTIIRKRHPSETLNLAGEMESDNVVKNLEASDMQTHMESLIRTLPENQQIVIRLSCFGGLDMNEISDATGISHSNVRQLLSRARKKLRQLFNE